MTIYESSIRETYAVGATAQTVFAVPFPFFDQTDLQVYVGGALQALGSDYTVTGGGGSGGFVTLASGVTNTKVTVLRQIAIRRTTDFPAAGGFKVPALNRELDRNTAILQELADANGRSLRPPADEDFDGEIPALTDRAGRLFGFDDDGQPAIANVTIDQMNAIATTALQAGRVAEVITPFVSDGVQTLIPTTVPLVSVAQVSLSIGGAYQPPQSGAYTVSAAGITLASPAPAGVLVGGVVGFAVEVGRVVETIAINGSGHLNVTYHDGETVDLGQVVGTNGTNGRGISSATVNGSGHLILTYSDATTADAGLVVGGVSSVAGRTGVVTLTVADVSGAAPLASPTFTGTPAVPTATNGTNTSQAASTAFVQAAIAALLNSAPASLDTLNELATALGNDPNFATTMVSALAAKAPLTSPTFVGTPVVGARGDAFGSALEFTPNGALGVSFHLYAQQSTGRFRLFQYRSQTGAVVNRDVLSVYDDGSLYSNGSLLLHAGNAAESIIIACGDETTAITAGTAKVTFRMPYAFTVTAVYADLVTAQASGNIFTVDINEAGTSILSTKLTIDNTETDSATAATAAVISDTALAARAPITVDVDQIGDGTAKGLKVTLVGRRVA